MSENKDKESGQNLEEQKDQDSKDSSVKASDMHFGFARWILEQECENTLEELYKMDEDERQSAFFIAGLIENPYT